MFESLTERMGKALRNLRGTGRLTEENTAAALKEVRSALLSADVHFRVAREFVDRVRAKSEGVEVTQSVTPGQQMVKIIHDELVELLGHDTAGISPKRPLRVLMVGLHGSGKTTTSAKLALYLRKQGYKPGMVACDVYRPAAIDQLETLGREGGFPVHADRKEKKVLKIAREGEKRLLAEGCDAVVFDTAGRLQVDQDLVAEVADLKKKIEPEEVFLVADSALGQEAVNVSGSFHEATSLTGIILTKLDGDARGGAALSMKSLTGVPIKFVGTGEKMDALEVFHPDRMASRILGMGDVVSLVEKAQQQVTQEEAEALQEKMAKGKMTMDDFLKQLRTIRKMGSMKSLMGMLPGIGSQLKDLDLDDGQLTQTEAIIQSMTPEEKEDVDLLNNSRRRRIARGSGTQLADVSQLVKGFAMVGDMTKQMSNMSGLQRMRALGSLGKQDLSAMGSSGGPRYKVKQRSKRKKKDRKRKSR